MVPLFGDVGDQNSNAIAIVNRSKVVSTIITLLINLLTISKTFSPVTTKTELRD